MIKNDLQWVAVSSVTGEPIAEFASIQCESVERRLCDYANASVRLAWDDAPVNWLEATTPIESTLILLQNGVPVWGGIIVARSRILGSATIGMELRTFEYILDRLFIGDSTFIQEQQTEIVKGLVDRFGSSTKRNPIVVDATPSTIRRDRRYIDYSDKTILDTLQELSEVIRGCEFTIEWRQDGGRFVPVLKTADRIGATIPAVSFDPYTFAGFAFAEDYTEGKGANRVIATTSADGDFRLQSDPYFSGDTKKPVIEYRLTPSTSITRKETLDAHAASALARLKDGTKAVSITAALESAPRLNYGWHLGDMIGFDVSDAAKFYPDMMKGTVRCVGYRIRLTGVETIELVLLDEGKIQ